MWTKNLSWKNKSIEKNPNISTKDIDYFQQGSCPPIEPNTEGPPILLKLIEFLKSNSTEMNQLFIKALEEKELNLVKKKIKLDGHHVDLKSYAKDSKIVGELIKQYLIALPESILTFERYDSYILAIHLQNKDDQIAHLKNLITTLPTPNRNVCTKLFSLLNTIHKITNTKKSSELAQIFSSILLYPKKKLYFRANDDIDAMKLIKLMIEECRNLFPSSTSLDLEKNNNNNGKNNNKLPSTVSPKSLRIATALTPSSLIKGSRNNFVRSHRSTKSVDLKLLANNTGKKNFKSFA